MIFLIDKTHTECQVVVYKSITDVAQRVEWQDIFEGKTIVIDENGREYCWDATQKNEIGSVYNYTLIPTENISEYIDTCLEMIQLNENQFEFTFVLH